MKTHLCNLLFVVDHKQWYGEENGSETINSFFKAPSCGQLIALLQAWNQIRETQAHRWETPFSPAVLPVSLGVTVQAGQRRQAQVTGAPTGQRLHEQLLVGSKLNHTNLVMQQL